MAAARRQLPGSYRTFACLQVVRVATALRKQQELHLSFRSCMLAFDALAMLQKCDEAAE
jgi:hypothetical protein